MGTPIGPLTVRPEAISCSINNRAASRLLATPNRLRAVSVWVLTVLSLIFRTRAISLAWRCWAISRRISFWRSDSVSTAIVLSNGYSPHATQKLTDETRNYLISLGFRHSRNSLFFQRGGGITDREEVLPECEVRLRDDAEDIKAKIAQVA